MGKYERKTERKLIFTKENLKRARERIANGESQRQVALSMSTKESTLRKRLKAGTVPSSLGRFKPIFTKEMEIELANHCRYLDSLFYGIGTKNLRCVAFQYADLNRLGHRFNTEKKMTGKDWVYAFCKRQKLSLRSPEKCSVGRYMGFNREQVSLFFKNLKKVFIEKKIPPHRMFNMDESGVSTVPNKLPKVFAAKGKRLVGKIVSADRGQTVTVVCCMSPTGIFIPPGIIFPRKRLKPELYYGAPIGTLPMISDSGYMKSDIFIDWLRHFQSFVKSSKEDPVLLILDNHVSHRSLEAVLYCREHHIILLSLPPHASHRLQPLDRSFFGPLKTAYSAEADKWMTSNPGQVINQRHIAEIFERAYSRVATILIAQNGFKSTGIFPYSDDIFSPDDFRPSEVTDKVLTTPQEDSSDDSDVPLNLVQQKLLQDKNINKLVKVPQLLKRHIKLKNFESVECSSRKQNEPEASTSTSVSVLAAPKTSLDSSSLTTLVSPLQIYPLQAPIEPQQRKRRSQKSELMTESPFKNALLEKEENSKTTASVKRKVFAEEEKSRKEKGKTIKGTKKEKSNELEVRCPSCNESENGDDWIMCSQCNLWWHIHCSSYDEKGPFSCDFCVD